MRSLSPPSVQLVDCINFESDFSTCVVVTSFRELTSSMCWSAWPDTVWRRCLMPSYPDMFPVDTKRYLTSFYIHSLCRNIIFIFFVEWNWCFCPQVVTPVVWNKPDIENSVPLWIIILAILAGLLLLALLIYVLYKVGAAVKRRFKNSHKLICYVLISNSCFLVVRLLQAIFTLRHRHGESSTQTAGCLWGLNDNRS